MTPLRKRMLEELQLRNLSEATATAYVGAVRRFAQYFGKSPEKLGPEQVRQYLLHLLNDKKDNFNTIQVYRGALKFLYVRVLKQSWFEEAIPVPKRRRRLPTVLTPQEITRILDRTSNLKHWMILATFYATALRCDELRHLKVSDIDSQRMILHIRKAKGSVQRDIALSPALLERLRVYYRWRRPKDWLFPSKQHPDRPSMTPPSAICAAKQGKELAASFWFIRTYFATPAPLTCSMEVRICAPSRFCSAMPSLKLPPSIFTCRSSGCKPSVAPSTHSDSDRSSLARMTADDGDRASARSRRCLSPTRSGVPEMLGDVLSPQQRKVLRDIGACRTAALGTYVQQCDHCSHQVIEYRSCRNRHCPKCHSRTRDQWLADRELEILPVPYSHVVFTLPHELAPQPFPEEPPKRLGAKIGFLAVLHTWTQRLDQNPHS